MDLCPKVYCLEQLSAEPSSTQASGRESNVERDPYHLQGVVLSSLSD